MDFQEFLGKFEELPGLMSISFYDLKNEALHCSHKDEKINDQFVSKFVKYLDKKVLDLTTKHVKIDLVKVRLLAYVEESVMMIVITEPNANLGGYNEIKNEFLNQALISL